jgi:DNA polymerase III subunit chi
MAELYFYHLQNQPLEAVLPTLLEKSLERRWRVVVQAGSSERVEALDALLWTYRDNSFLPHGCVRDANEAEHPIWLTAGDDNPNAADVRMLVDGAELPAEPARYSRVVVIFDGNEPEALEAARQQWRQGKELGLDVAYWQQADGGRWQRQN